MELERRAGRLLDSPFPVYADLVGSLLAAHSSKAAGGARDPVVAHALGACSAYSYADADTVATVMSRIGLEANGCVRITETASAMLIFSTAFLVQSRCGRAVVVCYRGTDPAALGNWLGDADVGSERMPIGAESFVVHAGFRRNMRATRWAVLEQLRFAAEGRSLLAPDARVDHPMEVLYLTGHSFGGAMAVLFALSLLGDEALRDLADTLRAVYTFGQPLVTCEPLPAAVDEVARKLFRHVTARDLVPSLPAAPWGRLTHFGEEYRFGDGEWRRAEAPVAQLESLREIPRSLFAAFATAARRDRARYTFAEHAPHHYLAALRPKRLLTELGDREE